MEDEQIMRIGVLTGGGDCPGLNAVIRAVVRKGVATYGHEFVGFRDGWRGPLEGMTMPLGIAEVRGILPRGGTILGSSRTNPFKIDGGVERIKANLAEQGVDALIAIGGEDTLGVATKLHDLGVHVVGVPKTIDNDLGATDYTFGFDTAVNIAMEAIDRLHTTAEIAPPHPGRRGDGPARRLDRAARRPRRRRQRDPAAGAAVRRRPGRRLRREALPAPVRPDRRGRRGRPAARGPDGRCTTRSSTRSATSASAASASGWPSSWRRRPARRPAPSCSATSSAAARRPRSTGCSPPGSACSAIDAVHEGDWGKMVALRGTDIVRVPLAEATRELKTVPLERYTEAEVFFGS